MDGTDQLTDDDRLFNTAGKIERNKHTLLLLISMCASVPMLTSIVMLFAAYTAPMFFVLAGFLLVLVSVFGIAFSSIVMGSFFVGVIFFFLGCLYLAFLYNNYNKLSFTALMLKIVIKVMSLYPSSIVVSLLSSVSACIIGFAYYVLAAGILMDRIKKDDANCPHENGSDVCVSNASTGLLIFVLFVGYYVFEVLNNFTHVVISGIFGSCDSPNYEEQSSR
ncbi:unnamed protein product [Ambrosiozyma monospora]|uniref:Unnamed protein product n=1 Tax=Ambrosiozyma monospora TaxID=43982 RepID=A0ACB5UA72_AMBMO|nr:unnamed protein product [Ambrosiozyma monospora]